VKRTIVIVVGLVTLAATAYVGSQLWAQQPGTGVRPASASAPAPSGGKTRVAILNLKYVVTNYRKWSTLQDQYKADLKVFEDKIVPLKGNFDALLKAVQDNKFTDPKFPNKEAAEKEMRRLKNQMQDIDEEAKTTLMKKQGDMMVSIYNEVAGAVGRFAQANDIDLVVHYNDGTTPVEMNSMDNIYRKINTGACTPVFWKPDVDISKSIVDTLNASYPAAPTTPTTPH
jgi:Skp family chaperone for outer membrane proteins